MYGVTIWDTATAVSTVGQVFAVNRSSNLESRRRSHSLGRDGQQSVNMAGPRFLHPIAFVFCALLDVWRLVFCCRGMLCFFLLVCFV